MSCYHIYDCDRCGGQAERLTNALKRALELLEDCNSEDIKGLKDTLENDGVDLS